MNVLRHAVAPLAQMDVLSIRAFEYRDDADYARILAIEAEALAAGLSRDHVGRISEA
ncbi:MAG TPA: hypothetical protein VN089_15440 [Duganella sp.]|nr:hypothetical protein [Duganella sp.]